MVQISLANSLSPSSSVLKWYEEQGGMKAKPLQANTTIYSPWNYAPNGVTSSFNYIQGIGAGASKNTYTIVGTYGQLDNGAVGVVYQGAINGSNTSQGSGPGTWTTMVVPKSFNSLGTRETLANRTNPRENGPVIAGLDWSDGRQAARFL
jgi:hypothetical protein